MEIPIQSIKYSDLNKLDRVQVLSVAHGLSEEMPLAQFEKIYLDEKQIKRLRYKEWYDIMSTEPEEAWPDMEWLLVIKDEQILQVIP
jgi:hypothetical protein